MIEIADGDSRVRVVPEAGGALAGFTWRGIDILRPASDEALAARSARGMASYPLVPYSNRIGQGLLRAGRRTHALRLNAPPEPHALHGIGWQRAWRVTDATPTRVAMSLAQVPDPDWPFRFACEQVIALRGGRLEASLEIANADTESFPAGLGFHPLFPAPAGTRLQTAWSSWWTVDARHLPVARLPVPAEADFRDGRVLDGWRVDNPFTAWSREAVFTYPTHRTRLAAGEALDHAIAYSPGDGTFLALEPVSHTIDAFALAANGVGGTGTRYLAAGERWRVSMAIEVMPADIVGIADSR